MEDRKRGALPARPLALVSVPGAFPCLSWEPSVAQSEQSLFPRIQSPPQLPGPPSPVRAPGQGVAPCVPVLSTLHPRVSPSLLFSRERLLPEESSSGPADWVSTRQGSLAPLHPLSRERQPSRHRWQPAQPRLRPHGGTASDCDLPSLSLPLDLAPIAVVQQPNTWSGLARRRLPGLGRGRVSPPADPPPSRWALEALATWGLGLSLSLHSSGCPSLWSCWALPGSPRLSLVPGRPGSSLSPSAQVATYASGHLPGGCWLPGPQGTAACLLNPFQRLIGSGQSPLLPEGSAETYTAWAAGACHAL